VPDSSCARRSISPLGLEAMDATSSNYRKRLLLLNAIALLFGLADSSLAAEPDSSSAIIVTDSAPGPSASVHGTVAFTNPSKPASKLLAETKTRSAQGDFVFRTEQPASPILPISRPEPRQPVAPLPTMIAPLPVQVAQHHEEVDLPDPIGKLLIEAHSISLRATTENDYSQIVELCTTALRQGAQKEDQRFVRQLTSWSLNRRGQLRADQGEQELASADFQGALDHHSDNWRALHNRGVSLAQQGVFAEAFDDFNRVIQLRPQYAKAFVNRATLFMQAGDLQSALEDYLIAAKIDPDFSSAQLGIGRIHHRLGQWDEAIAFFETAAQGDPTNAEILCSRGDLLADMGQYGKALADYAHAIEVEPDFAHAYRNGSWLLATCPDAQFRDTENALLGARQALEFDYGQRHVALDTLAAALANSGQYDEAIYTLHEALAIAPDQSKPAYAQRMQLYQQQQPFRTEPAGEVSQVAFEVTDR